MARGVPAIAGRAASRSDGELTAAVWCALFAAVLMMLMPAGPAHGQTRLPSVDRCAAGMTDLELAKTGALDRLCSQDGSKLRDPVVAVEFTGARLSEHDRLYLTARVSHFEQLIVQARDRDGSVRERRYSSQRIRPDPLDLEFTVAAPGVNKATVAIRAIFVEPRSFATIESTRLVAERPAMTPTRTRTLLILMLLGGFLLMPIIFDVIFWRLLRERFALWHAMLAGMLAAHILITGPIVFFVPLSAASLAVAASGSFTLLMVAATLFSRSFIEPGKLDPRLRAALEWCAALALALLVVRLLPGSFGQRWGLQLYFAGHAPILFVLIAAMIDGCRRGSRSAWFLAVAWTPFFVVGAVRIVSYSTDLVPPIDASWLFRIASVVEIVGTALGVADRVLRLKHQRDEALSTAEHLSGLASHDALTGLRNRHALTERFETLYCEGFTTLALLDLDRFKRVNDTLGHAIGDEVLRVVGQALSSEPEDRAVAFRLGGEEFVLLLRGGAAAERAERLRQAIPRHVAKRVPQLGGPVTASMGVVETDAGGLGSGFAALYERADTLLYEAKEAGRNRSIAERVTVFEPPARSLDAAA